MSIPTATTLFGLAFGLVVAAPAPPPAVPTPSEGETEKTSPSADVETHVYDLTGILPEQRTDQRYREVLPMRLDRNWDEQVWDLHRHEDDNEIVDHVIGMLEELVAPDEFSYEHREIYSFDDRSLLITAPAGVHAAARELIDAIAALSRRRAVLEIDVYRLGGGGGALESGPPGTLFDAPGSSRLWHQEVSLPIGRTHEHRALHTTSIVREWSSEIAQGAGISEPEVATIETGNDLLLRVEDDHATGAFRLRVVQRLSELLGVDSQEYRGSASIRLDGTVMRSASNGHLDQPRIAHSTVVTSRSLAVGDAAVTVSAIETSLGTVRYATRYRLVSAEPPPQAVPVGGGRVALVGYDLSGAVWRPLQAPKVTRHALWPTGWHDFSSHDLTIEPVGFPSREPTSERGLDRALETLWDRGDVYQFTHGSLHVVLGDPALAGVVPGVVRPFLPQAGPASVDVLVTGRSRNGGAPRVLGRLVLPVDAAGSSMAVGGVSSLSVHGYDVDVAQDASRPEPLVVGFLDGMSVRAECVGREDVAVDLLLHRLVGRETVDLGADGVGEVDRLAFDSVQLTPMLSRAGEVVTFRDVGSADDEETIVDVTVRITSP